MLVLLALVAHKLAWLGRAFSVCYTFFGSFVAWLGLAWLGLAWLGLAWLGLAWLGLVVPFRCVTHLFDICLAWLGLAWLGLAWSYLLGVLHFFWQFTYEGSYKYIHRTSPEGPRQVTERFYTHLHKKYDKKMIKKTKFIYLLKKILFFF